MGTGVARRERPTGPPPVGDLERFRLRPRGPEATAHVGMVVFLGSWAMLFAGLFLAYAFVRARAPAWPPAGTPPLPVELPALNTLVIAASSAVVARAARAEALGRSRAAGLLLGAAAALGAIFLALQLVVWASLWGRGLVPSGGPFGSVFYALTAFHALHVVVGLLALAALAARAARRGSAGRTAVRLWGMYWHFVGVVWIALYLTLYVA